MQTELTGKVKTNTANALTRATTNTSTNHPNATNTHVKQDIQNAYSAVELKGSLFTLPVLQIKTTVISDIESALVSHLSKALKFFESAPVVIDLGKIKNTDEVFDFSGLMRLLAQQQLIPVGVKNASNQQNVLAKSAGLAILKGELPQQNEKKGQTQELSKNESNVLDYISTAEEGIETGTAAVVEVTGTIKNQTKIITQPVRSGQKVYAKGGDLIILAPVNHGAEIIADGNIHVYSTMRGRALAGVLGDVKASIFCQSMDAELVAIAGNFRVFEEDMPAAIKSKSVRIHLDQEQLIITEL